MKTALSLVATLILVASQTANAAEAWVPLITAETFPQWTVEGASKAEFTFNEKSNTVTGRPVGDNPKNSFLCSPRQYKDFELKFRFLLSKPFLNSGVQFRSEAHAEGVRGPQFEMDVASSEDYSWMRRLLEPAYNFVMGRVAFDYSTAGIYGEGMDTGWIYPGLAGGDPQEFAAHGGKITNKSGWNPVRLRAHGPRVRTWMAGVERASFEYPEIDKPGVICLQVHGGSYKHPERLFIRWRDLQIREIKK